jgi:hypothetical protein
MLKYLFDPLMEYPLTFWMVTTAAVIESGSLILRRDLVRLIPIPMRLLLVLAFSAAMAPMAVEAFEALVRNQALPKTVEGVQTWPTMGFLAWLSFLSVALTFLAVQLWEPFKEELLVNFRSRLVNYLGTFVLAGTIHSCGLASFLFIYSYQRDIPIFTMEHVLLMGLGQVGAGLAVALWLRTLGANRFLADLLGLALTGTVAFWVADYLGLSDPAWVLWICLFSTSFWAVWGFGRFVREMIRFRRKKEGEALPEEEPTPLHVCPDCDREFVTLHGLKTHAGKMHKRAVAMI